MFVSCTSESFLCEPLLPLVCRSIVCLLSEFLCLARYVNGNLSGSVSEIVQKGLRGGVWVFVSGDSSDGQNVMDFPVRHSKDNSDCIPETPRISKQVDSLPWEHTWPQDKTYVWERIEAPMPPLRRLRPTCNFIHRRQLSPFPERLALPFSNDEILCDYEEIVLHKNRSIYYVGQDDLLRGLGPTCG